MPRSSLLDDGELTDNAYYILLSLTEPKHGYMIMKNLEEITNRRISISPASMYTTLKKLLSAELIQLIEEERKKTYIATEKGFQFLIRDISKKKAMINQGEMILKDKGII